MGAAAAAGVLPAATCRCWISFGSQTILVVAEAEAGERGERQEEGMCWA